jgi:hypothetical protein
MSECERGFLLNGVDILDIKLKFDGYEVEESLGEVTPRVWDYRPCEGDVESSGRCHREQERHQHFRRYLKQLGNQVKRFRESFFSIRCFTWIILFASVGAFALVIASAVIQGMRPYP